MREAAGEAGGQAAAPVPPNPGKAGPIPWEDPHLPRLPALGRTLGELLFNPRGFFPRLGRHGWGEPLAFGLITGTAGLLAGFFWSLLLYAGASQGLGDYWGSQSQAVGTGLAVLLMVAAPAVTLGNLAFGAACLWGALALAGAGRDFAPAWRIYGYAQGAMVMGVIPVLGLPLAGLWVLVLVYLGVQTVCKTSGGRTLMILVLFLGLQVFWLVLLGGVLLALLGFLGFLLFLG